MATNNYSSIYNIKNFAMSELAPKYFNIDETNDLNIGLLGFINEYMGTIAEDSFNATSTYIQEMFPHLAVMPETIYNNATLFQLNSTFTTPAVCQIYLFISEATIHNNATQSNNTGQFNFILDSDTVIDIEGIHFMPDYDILISYTEHSNDYVYTAQYNKVKNDTTYNNSISSLSTNFLKLKRIYVENENYLQIEIDAHQVDKFTQNETVIINDVIISPRFTVNFEGKLANFEVLYKSPSDTTYKQLKKQMYGSLPIEDDFCYYEMVDEGELEISFSTRDGYFYPEDNSELLIYYFTTLGSEGNFNAYSGSDTSVYVSSETYQYNNNISVFAIPASPATDGSEALTLEQLRRMTVEMFSTVGSYTNENDLQIYFDNFNNKYNSNILFLKTRDDIFSRRFSAYSLFKNQYNDIYSTNTLDIYNMKYSTTPANSDFDMEIIQDNYYMLKPGHIFTYNNYNTITIHGSNFTNYNSYVVTSNNNPRLTGVSKVLHDGVSVGYTFNVVTQTLTLSTHLTAANDNDEFIIYDDQIPTSAIIKKNKTLSNYTYITFTGNGTQTEFTISNDEIFSGIEKILVDGSEVTNYTFNSLTRKITFTTAPASNKEIRVYNKNNESFVYSNPFLVYFKKNPSMVNCYLNSVYSTHKLYHKDANKDIINQFVCSNLSVNRTATLHDITITERFVTNSTTSSYVLDTSFASISNIKVNNVLLNTSNYTYTPSTRTLSFTQSLSNNASVQVNGITNDGVYNISVIVTPASAPAETINTNLSLRLVYSENGNDKWYKTMDLDNTSEYYDENLHIYPFKCSLLTNDIIENNTLRLTNVTSMDGTNEGYHTVPIENATLKIITYYYNGTESIKTNEYTTELDPVTFVKSVDLIHSTGEFVDTGLTEKRIKFNSFPLVSADTLADESTAKEFFNILSTESAYLATAMDKLTNNFSIDIKFYNSYGRAKNFKVDMYSESFTGNGTTTAFELDNKFTNISKVLKNNSIVLPSEYTYNIDNNTITFTTAPTNGTSITVFDDTTLDKVNIKLKLKVKFAYGTDIDSTIYKMKIFIKEYTESINTNGANSIYISNLIRELENNFASIVYLKFIGLNDYNCMIQSIENSTTDLSTLTKYERMKYVPEYLTISLDDIEIVSI